VFRIVFSSLRRKKPGHCAHDTRQEMNQQFVLRMQLADSPATERALKGGATTCTTAGRTFLWLGGWLVYTREDLSQNWSTMSLICLLCSFLSFFQRSSKGATSNAVCKIHLGGIMQYAGRFSAVEYRIRGYGFALGDANQLHRTRWDMVISLIGR
jgi:hypothetical protein